VIIAKADRLVETDPGPGFDPGLRTEGGVAVAPLSWSWSAPWLGKTWNLTDFARSPIYKTRGAQGFGPVDPEHWWDDAPTLDGSTWQGMRTGRGEPFLPLVVQGSTSAEFLSNHRDFIASLNPRQQGVMRITAPDGTYRENRLRYVSGAAGTMELDPVARRHQNYGITWATADPYWQGPAVERTYEYEVAPAFFPGPPFTLGKGLTITGATIDNPGDVAAYPTWRIAAPFTAFSVGVGTALVTATITKASGWIDIDMNPTKLTVVDEAGVDRWSALTAAEFTSIPAGTGLPLALSVTGSAVGTSVRLSFVPRYWSAW
jgi:hypothetical protein